MIITICAIIYTNDTTTCGILNSLTMIWYKCFRWGKPIFSCSNNRCMIVNTLSTPYTVSITSQLKSFVWRIKLPIRNRLCFNTVLKLVLWMQITSVLNAKGLLFAHKNKNGWERELTMLIVTILFSPKDIPLLQKHFPHLQQIPTIRYFLSCPTFSVRLRT